MTREEKVLAQRFGVRDPQGAIDRWHARVRLGRSTVSPVLRDLLKDEPVPRKRRNVTIDDTPRGLVDGLQVVGYLGFIGTEPIVCNGNLLMWSCRRRAFIEMREPARRRASWWKRLCGAAARAEGEAP